MEDLRNSEETSIPSTTPPHPQPVFGDQNTTFYLSGPQTPEHNDF